MTDHDDRLTRLLLAHDIEQFYFHEADLLDQRQYEPWLALLAEDIRYWMPMRRNVKYDDRAREFTRADHDINWFDEGKDTLIRRVRQIETGIHWAEEPVSRISHLITNIRILAADPDWHAPTDIRTGSRFLIYRNRMETETDILVGKREDTLRRTATGWQIARRKILLDQNVLLSKNLTFFF